MIGKRGLRISRSKTESLRMNTEDTAAVKMDGVGIPDVSQFKYLGSTIDREGGCEADVQKRIGNAWAKWRSLKGVMCDKRMPNRLKGKVYRTCIRPVMLYGSEAWPIRKVEERKLGTTEMRMLRWSTGKTMLDRVPNEKTRKLLQVRPIDEKVRERRMRWFGHVERRDEQYAGKLADQIKPDGKRRRGRPQQRWDDNVKADLKFLGLTREDAQDRAKWRKLTCMADPRSTSPSR